MPAKPTYRADVDGLRALAIVPVVLFHAFPGKLPGGFAGVDVFFVISGFLISRLLQHALRQGSFSLVDFYGHRARRLLPALLLVLAASLAFGWVELLPDEFAQLRRHAVAGAGFAQNFVLWSEAGYFDQSSDLKPLMHLWSLSIEEQFYLVYPVLLWCLWRWHAATAPVLAALALLSFGVNLYLSSHDPVQDFFGPHARAWELLAGAWFAASGLDTRPRAAHWNQLLSAAGMLLLALAFGWLHGAQPYPGWRALLPVCGALLLLAGGPSAWLNRHLLASRPLVLIGAISYPLYLWHWPLLSFSRIADGLPSVERNGAVVLSFALAWLTWRYVERPLRYSRVRPWQPAALLAGLGVLALVAALGPPQNSAAHEAMARHLAANRNNAPQPQSCASLTGAPHPEDWCNAGNAGAAPPDTVLMGDSFANAYVDLLRASGERGGAPRGFRQIGRGHCPALLDYGPEYCRQIVKAEAAYVAATAPVRTVVLAAHWPIYNAGKYWPRDGHGESGAAFRAAFERTVEHYQRLGKRVVVLLAPPTGANPETCVPRPLHLVSKGICQRSLAQGLASDGDYRRHMLPWLARHQVAVFDPLPLLCTQDGCRLKDGDHMLYADWMHVSRYGARWLAREGAAQLDAALSP